ncbi:MAG: site-specific integrase [Paludibacter sp.]|nr:site-specific integrase [Paludibacter sp.]
MDCSITLYLDQRIKRISDIYIVKLRVLSPTLRVTKMYSTNFKLTSEEFELARSKKPKGKFVDLSIELNKLLSKALEIAESIIPFSFEKFEKEMFSEPRNKADVIDAFKVAIEENKSLGRLGNADNYQNSLNSISKFLEKKADKKVDKLLFSEITTEWLQKYEEYMKTNGKSTTTISMYVRALRAIFNSSISKGDISSKIYPFGKEKSKYKISSVKKVKKTLKPDELKKLFKATGSEEQLRAKAFFFFSYNCSGMNFKDIANLTYGQIDGDRLKFFRKKTENTTSEQTEISVYLTPFAHDVIKRYGSENKGANTLIFSIITKEMSAEEKQKAIKNFTRSVNQGLKKLAVKVGIDENISTYYARHSFSTNAIRSGASMELVSEQLGHADLKTTQNYFSGFEDDSIEKLTKKLMKF